MIVFVGPAAPGQSPGPYRPLAPAGYPPQGYSGYPGQQGPPVPQVREKSVVGDEIMLSSRLTKLCLVWSTWISTTFSPQFNV